MRTTVFDGETRDSVLLLLVDGHEHVAEAHPVYTCVFSSAAARDPEGVKVWMRWADPQRLSLVMDTPATAALRRWCAGGARFFCATRQVQVGDDDIRVIVGRVEAGSGRSPLVVIPSTEFGARWFESACMEDPVLDAAIVDDPALFDREADHLDVVLTHLLLEERFLGTGSWRRRPRRTEAPSRWTAMTRRRCGRRGHLRPRRRTSSRVPRSTAPCGLWWGWKTRLSTSGPADGAWTYRRR